MLEEKVRTSLSINKYAKEKAKEIFSKYGLSLSDAVNIFLFQSVYSRGIPFKIEIPNEETEKAIKNVNQDKNVEEVTLEQLKKEAKQCLK